MKAITIIGGGLAGLTLGIGLRQRGIPVTVIEAGSYPRHRVCGEFINGRGLRVLNDSGLAAALPSAQTRPASDVAFFSGQSTLGRRTLPVAALSVSRFVLDAALSEKFCQLGGELRTHERWRGDACSEGVVLASGRRAQPVDAGWRWFGLKVHARGVKLDADLEMYLAPNAYVGLCRLADGSVNACGLFRRRVHDGAQQGTMELLRGRPGSRLFARMNSAQIDEESFCAVAGLALEPQSINPHECRVGDALTMIPPITGNGMSMAFESAWLATEPLVAFANGVSDWTTTTARVAAQLEGAFSARLRWAKLFHRALFLPWSRTLLQWAIQSPVGWRVAFSSTR